MPNSNTKPNNTTSLDVTIPIDEWTQAKVEGTGVFDILMKAHQAHLIEEYKHQRIRGNDYSTVYLGSLQQVLQSSLEFVLQRRKLALEAELLKQQLELAKLEAEKAKAQIKLAHRELDIKDVELQLKQAELALVPIHIELKKSELEIKKAELEIAKEQLKKLPEEIEHLKAQTALIKQNTVNAVTQNTTLVKEQRKLDAEYDFILTSNLKGVAETALINQKTLSEKAQVEGAGVDEDSVLGRQKNLYKAQTEGYQRNAEAEVSKLLINTWATRRTTDEGVSANTTNKLDDETIGKSVIKLLSGVGIQP